MAEIKKYLGTDALSALVGQIKSEDAKVLQAAKDEDAKVLQDAKDYSDSLAENYEAAGAAATALDDAKAYADGKDEAIAEAKKAGTDAQAAAEAADAKAVAAQGEVDALETYVGTIPEDATSTNVVAYVQEKTAGIASSSALEELDDRVSQAETDIDNIEKDYLKAEDKTELEGKITTAQNAADQAKEDAAKVADDLATEITNRTDADDALDERIAELEGTIVGLSGAMHFKGVVEADPTTITEGYENGDTVIYGNKEYVFNNGAFVEFGDATVNAEAITALTGRMDTAEDNITALGEAIDAEELRVDGLLANKVDKVEGKGLSTNDLTDALKANYDAAYTHSQEAHAPANAQENLIESVKVNGTALTITDKAIDITVPTDNADLANGAGYLVAADVEDKAEKATTLEGYGITDAYTTAQTDEAIANAVGQFEECTADDVNALFA